MNVNISLHVILSHTGTSHWVSEFWTFLMLFLLLDAKNKNQNFKHRYSKIKEIYGTYFNGSVINHSNRNILETFRTRANSILFKFSASKIQLYQATDDRKKYKTTVHNEYSTCTFKFQFSGSICRVTRMFIPPYLSVFIHHANLHHFEHAEK